MHRLPVVASDEALVRALRAGHPGAPAALFDRHAPHVRRVLARVMGTDPELPDLLHDVFVQAFGSLDDLADPALLKGWLTSIAVFTARGCIRRRARRRWLRFVSPDRLPHVEAPVPTGEVIEALRCTYEALNRLPVDERTAFSLRAIDGMELTEVAAACRTSLATVKRRLRRAEARFLEIARSHPVLRDWADAGPRGGGR